MTITPSDTEAVARIVVVDDDPGIRETVSEFLGQNGYAVDQAKDIYSKDQEAELLKKGLTILRKTLQLNFYIRGDEVYPGEDEVNKEGESWIMR